jgi:hypothetical protein
MNLVRS